MCAGRAGISSGSHSVRVLDETTRSRSARSARRCARQLQAGTTCTQLPLMTGSDATAVHLRIHTHQHTCALSTPHSTASGGPSANCGARRNLRGTGRELRAVSIRAQSKSCALCVLCASETRPHDTRTTREATEEQSRDPQCFASPSPSRCAARSIAPRSSAHRQICSFRLQRAPICPVRCSICRARARIPAKSIRCPSSRQTFEQQESEKARKSLCRSRAMLRSLCRCHAADANAMPASTEYYATPARGVLSRRHHSCTHARMQHSSFASALASALSPHSPGPRPPASSTPMRYFPLTRLLEDSLSETLMKLLIDPRAAACIVSVH